MHEDGKRLDLAQYVLPVGIIGGAAKHASKTTLLAGIIAADPSEHMGWRHDRSSLRFCAIIFCGARLDNVVFIVSRRVLDEYRPRGVSPRLSMAQCHQSERVTNTGVIRGHLLRPE